MPKKQSTSVTASKKQGRAVPEKRVVTHYRGIEVAEKRIERALRELSEEGVEMPTRSQVAEKTACSFASLRKSVAWKNRSQLFPDAAFPVEKRVAKAIRALTSEGKTELRAEDIAKKAKCSYGSVRNSAAWKRIRSKIKPSRIEKRRRIEKAINEFLAAGKTRFRSKEIAQKARCTSNEVLASPAWKQHRLPRMGTVEERIIAALNEIKATGRIAKMKEVMEKSGCCSASLERSPAWKKHRQSRGEFAEKRVEKVLQEFFAMGKTSPLLRELAEKTKMSMTAVWNTSAWKKHRQSIHSNTNRCER